MKFQFYKKESLELLKAKYSNYFSPTVADSFFSNVFDDRFFFILEGDSDQNILVAAQCAIKETLPPNKEKIILLDHVLIDKVCTQKELNFFIAQIESTLSSISSRIAISVENISNSDTNKKLSVKLDPQLKNMLKAANLSPSFGKDFIPDLKIKGLMTTSAAETVSNPQPELIKKIYDEYCEKQNIAITRDLNHFTKFVKYHAACGNILLATSDCFAVYNYIAKTITDFVSVSDKSIISFLLALTGQVNQKYPNAKIKSFLTYKLSNFVNENINYNEVQRVPAFYINNKAAFAPLLKKGLNLFANL